MRQSACSTRFHATFHIQNPMMLLLNAHIFPVCRLCSATHAVSQQLQRSTCGWECCLCDQHYLGWCCAPRLCHCYLQSAPDHSSMHVRPAAGSRCEATDCGAKQHHNNAEAKQDGPAGGTRFDASQHVEQSSSKHRTAGTSHIWPCLMKCSDGVHTAYCHAAAGLHVANPSGLASQASSRVTVSSPRTKCLKQP